MSHWHDGTAELGRILQSVSIRGPSADAYDIDEGFTKWLALTIDVQKQQRSLFLIGNGASASMASHFASDLAKNAHIHTQVFSDLSLITAISNDIGYEWVFAEPLRRRSESDDMLVAISSSGESPNILKAAEVARERGVTTVTLSAMAPDNRLRDCGDVNIWIPAKTYGHAETGHAAILHHWMDMVQTATEIGVK